ncbi:hypothetical protein ACFU7X_29500 [Streptomyces chartreusis]|uniref:hypothetical protein n=1 Tax=Streptomyces chartreusis TaxID=1969 RepID=UPI00368DBED3
MDPISVALLAALAGGAGGEVGRQCWSGLSALVRRPFQHSRTASSDPAVSSGEAELVRLQQAPADPARAQALSTALAVRAGLDPEFFAGLQQWQERVKLLGVGEGDTHSEISGGTFSGPVLLGRDFSNVSFAAAPSPTTPDTGTRSAQD